MKQLTKAIEKASPEAIDGLWAILKYRDIGILRKLRSMAALLNLNPDKVADSAPTDENGRILDKATRSEIHDSLLTASKNLLD